MALPEGQAEEHLEHDRLERSSSATACGGAASAEILTLSGGRLRSTTDRHADVRHLVSSGPLQGDPGGRVFLLAVAYFFNHGGGDQDGEGESLDQIEAADAGEQNEW